MTVTLVVPFGAQGSPISYGTVDYSPMAYRADITNSRFTVARRCPGACGRAALSQRRVLSICPTPGGRTR